MKSISGSKLRFPKDKKNHKRRQCCFIKEKILFFSNALFLNEAVLKVLLCKIAIIAYSCAVRQSPLLILDLFLIHYKINKYQVVKVSPGGSLPGGKASLPPCSLSLPPPPSFPLCPLALTELVGTIVGFRVPSTSFEAKG